MGDELTGCADDQDWADVSADDLRQAVARSPMISLRCGDATSNEQWKAADEIERLRTIEAAARAFTTEALESGADCEFDDLIAALDGDGR